MLALKNKAEREAFVKNYRAWKFDDGTYLDIWKEIPALGLRFYRYDFANGAALIVTEYKHYITWKKEYVTEHKLCLILPDDDPYVDNSSVCGAESHKTYTPTGCSLGTVVDYMTKNKSVI